MPPKKRWQGWRGVGEQILQGQLVQSKDKKHLIFLTIGSLPLNNKITKKGLSVPSVGA